MGIGTNKIRSFLIPNTKIIELSLQKGLWTSEQISLDHNLKRNKT